MKKGTNKLERVTTKWWFFAILISMQFLIMPFSTKNFNFERIGDIISVTLSNSFQLRMYNYYSYFQLISIVILLLLFILKNKFRIVFEIYVFISYLCFAFLQNVAMTETYGFSMVTINVLMFLFVAYFWLKELICPENDYSFSNLKWRNSWLIPLAFIAFWAPLTKGVFDFNLRYLLYSGSSLAFCLMTPVFINDNDI